MEIFGKIVGTIIGEFIIWAAIALIVWVLSLMFNFEWSSEIVWGIWGTIALCQGIGMVGKWVDD